MQHDACHAECKTTWSTFFKEVNRLLPLRTEASRPHLTYKIQIYLYSVLKLLFEKSHLSSNQETIPCFLTNRFLGTNCYSYRFKLSFKKPSDASIQKSNQLAIQKAIAAYWLSKQQQKYSSLTVCLNVQSG